MDELLNKWLKGEITDDEFRREVGDEDLTKYRQILAEVDLWQPDLDKTIIDLDQVIKSKKEAPVRTIGRWVPLSVAASIVLLIGFLSWQFFLQPYDTYKTGAGEISTVQLPDGSTLLLAPTTEVKWNKRIYAKKKERVLKLKGKAFFDVEKGKSFTVASPNGLVEVLGTEFEIDDFQGGMVVTCFEGRVRATAKNKSIAINAGETSEFSNAMWSEKTPFSIRKKPTYKGPDIEFDNAQLSQVIAELQRRFNLEIIPGEVDMKRRFTGSFPANDMDIALKLVFNSMDIRFERKGQKVYLLK